MADLPIIADRLNDTEISGNAPVTETLMRRIGSNINYLLDFLGVPDGSTSATGQISDLVNAINVIDGHTITKQGVFTNNSTQVVGTYSPIKFVNRLFWTRRESTGTQTIAKVPRAFMKQLDGGPNVRFDANPTTPASTTTAGGQALTTGSITSDLLDPSADTYGIVNGIEPYQRFFDGAVGTIGYESGMRAEDWTLIGRLNWRDFDTQAVVRTYFEGSQFMHVYMSYQLDVQSAPIYAP